MLGKLLRMLMHLSWSMYRELALTARSCSSVAFVWASDCSVSSASLRRCCRVWMVSSTSYTSFTSLRGEEAPVRLAEVRLVIAPQGTRVLTAFPPVTPTSELLHVARETVSVRSCMRPGGNVKTQENMKMTMHEISYMSHETSCSSDCAADEKHETFSLRLKGKKA